MKLKTILVGLDITDYDEHIIKFTTSFVHKAEVGKVLFIHNIKKYEISELFAERLKDINLEEIIYDRLQKKVKEHYGSDVPYEILISEDSSTENLVSYIANKYGVELVIMGNKKNAHGSGTVSGKLLRILKHDILLVPPGSTADSKHVLATTDFSKNAQKGIRRAMSWAECTGASVSCLNVFKIPQVYFPYLNKEEAVLKIENHVNKQFSKQFARMRLSENLPRKLSAQAGSASTAERIQVVAEQQKADIIFIADKGHSSLVSLLVGSTTEEMFTSALNMPLWISKQ